MKKLLVIVDYQNDFVNGSLGFDAAVKIEDNISQRITEYRNNNDDVCFTFDTHYENYSETQEGKNLPVPHCIKDTNGWKLYGKVAHLKESNDKEFHKITFASKELFEYLCDNKYDEIELAGVVSNICVISNAVIAKTAQPETKIVVRENCIASNDTDMNICAIKVMKTLQIHIV